VKLAAPFVSVRHGYLIPANCVVLMASAHSAGIAAVVTVSFHRLSMAASSEADFAPTLGDQSENKGHP
jgi:hypothetical protein